MFRMFLYTKALKCIQLSSLHPIHKDSGTPQHRHPHHVSKEVLCGGELKNKRDKKSVGEIINTLNTGRITSKTHMVCGALSIYLDFA